jgi:hypothetical protein
MPVALELDMMLTGTSAIWLIMANAGAVVRNPMVANDAERPGLRRGPGFGVASQDRPGDDEIELGPLGEAGNSRGITPPCWSE